MRQDDEHRLHQTTPQTSAQHTVASLCHLLLLLPPPPPADRSRLPAQTMTQADGRDPIPPSTLPPRSRPPIALHSGLLGQKQKPGEASVCESESSLQPDGETLLAVRLHTATRRSCSWIR